MGMFDTFEVNNTIKCEYCNKDNIIEDIQVKKFDCTLEYFEIGSIPDIENSSTFTIEDYDWCCHCKKSIPLFLGFYKGIYIGTFESEKIAMKQIDQFDILKHYKEIHIKQKKYKTNFEHIKSDIENTFDHHTNKSVNLFFMLHSADILDFNIINNIKNIVNKYKDI